MTSNPFMARFASEPCFVAAEKQARFDSCLSTLMTVPHINEMIHAPSMAASASNDDGFWPSPDSWQASYRPYTIDQNGILQIPVKGVLLNDFPWQISSWATGYIYIIRAIARGLEDFNVRGIALVCDTPGGLVAGNQDCVDAIYAARGQKPIRGFAHESAYSAGYNIVSATDHVTVSRTGGVGSIGVVTGHMNVSGAMAKAGLEFTYIFAGAHKVDGNPYEALSPEVKARMQTRIDELYGVFVGSVARNRGMTEQAVRDTEALCFTATEATSNGLADVIGSLDEAVSAYADFLDDPSDDSGDEGMTTNTGASAVDQAAAIDTARTEAATAMQARIGAILGSKNAEGRQKQANYLAFKTSMSAEEADAMLAESAVEAAPVAPAAAAAEPAAAPFAAAMTATAVEPVGATASGAAPGSEKPNRGQRTRELAGRIGLKGFAAPTVK